MGVLDWLKGDARVDPSSRHNPLLIVVTGKIYSWDGQNVEVRGGSGGVHCLAQYRGAIFGGELDSISNYASGLDLSCPLPVAERGTVTAMCLHDDTLYDASITPDKHFEIRKALIGNLVAERPGPVLGLASRAGLLFDCGLYGVLETMTSRKISDSPCDAICTYNNRLVVASGRKISDIESGDVLGRGAGRVTAMCSYNGRLLDAQFGGGIFDSAAGRLVLSYDAIDRVRGRKSKTQAASCLFHAQGLV